MNKNHHPIEVAIVGVIALLQAALWLARVLSCPWLHSCSPSLTGSRPQRLSVDVAESPSRSSELVLQLACAARHQPKRLRWLSCHRVKTS